MTIAYLVAEHLGEEGVRLHALWEPLHRRLERVDDVVDGLLLLLRLLLLLLLLLLLRRRPVVGVQLLHVGHGEVRLQRHRAGKVGLGLGDL